MALGAGVAKLGAIVALAGGLGGVGYSTVKPTIPTTPQQRIEQSVRQQNQEASKTEARRRGELRRGVDVGNARKVTGGTQRVPRPSLLSRLVRRAPRIPLRLR